MKINITFWVYFTLFVCALNNSSSAQTINTFPYYENFEATNGNYTFGGSQFFTWGTPAKTIMNTAGQGSKSWVSGPLNQYVNIPLSDTYLQTPVFNFTNVKAPYISFKFLVELENNWMGVVFESSVNNGPWTMVGSYNEPNDSCNTLNWYNDNRGAGISWSGAVLNSPCGGRTYTPGCGIVPLCGKWNTARHCITNLAGQANVRFRWRFVRNSGGYECDHEGFAIDSVVIAEASSGATFTNNTVCAGSPMLFNSSSGKCGSATRWNFGDGSSMVTATNPIKVYNTHGTYQVRMITQGSCGKQDTLTKSVTVLPPPVVTRDTSLLKNRYCASDAPVTLNGTWNPAGGNFFVNGNAAATFDPVVLGTGVHRVVYVYTEPSGNKCTVRDTQLVTVYVPSVSIDSLGGSYCLSSPVVTLKGSPAGGAFTVNGTPATSFDAATLGLGTHIITYTYVDPFGCVGTDSKTIEVVSNIVAQISGLSNSYCSYENPATLNATPVGGSFTIDGNPAIVLNPALLDTGMHRVIYSYSDGGSCGDKDTFDFRVVKVVAQINNLDSVYCPTSPAMALTGSPAGGNFYVDGSPAFSLNPASLSVALHKVLYVYTDPVYLCVDSVEKTIRIDKPDPKFTDLYDSYCKNSANVDLKATPAGGVFKVEGVVATQINPTLLDTGFYNIVYEYTNPATGCKNTVSKTIYIAPLPKPQFIGLDSVFCITSDLVPLNAQPLGGAFTINSLPVQMLDPSVLDVNMLHVVEYQYVEQNYGCMASVKKNFRIVTPPSLTVSGIKQTYCANDASFTPVGNPSGGKFIVNDRDTVSAISPSVLGSGTHKITYYYNAANGCDAAINQSITVMPPVTGNIAPDSVSVCPGEEVTLTFSGNGNIKWMTGQTSNTITFVPAATRFYTLTATDCADFADSAFVFVKPAPVADFSLSVEEGLIPLPVVATAKNVSTDNILWHMDTASFAKINPLQYTINNPGLIKVTLIVDSLGCTDTLTKTINAIEKVMPVKLPNVFTPDNDGMNDDFGINTDAVRFVKECSFQVFNRWGNLLFETSNPNQRWDGTDKGAEAPDGVYFFILNGSLNDNSPVKLSGPIQIIRGK